MTSLARRIALGCTVLLLVPPTLNAGDDVSFSRDVQPLLAAKCFRCHGPDEESVQAGLRLDRFETATAKLESGSRAIVPGQPGASELIARVTADDVFTRMPPEDAGESLKPAEVELLRKWIASGANYERHWAWVPPRRPVPPLHEVSEPSWVRNPIDAFVLKRLDEEGLPPSPASDPRVLLRRVSLDLTGLPPSITTVDRVLADPRPDAYERYVDELLASPAYGERWGRVWLDLARYADSAGYAQDPPRTIWMYRDWVIAALNENKPYDEFTIEQIAGDLLPDPGDDELIATAFHRNTMTNSEGGTNDEEFRNAAVVDRVNTTFEVWMGVTMGCAQCHTHKYDPIAQEEYFRVFAVLNNTADADRGDESPNHYVMTPEQQRRRRELQERIAKLEREIAAKAEEEPQLELPAEGPLTARYVRVEQSGQGVFLHVAEVQAFVGDENVALSGTASQISTDYGGEAKRAIDGNTDGDYFAANSTTHTAKADDPWWEVELGKPVPVEKIVLWNRTDGGTGARLKDFRIVALDAQRQPVFVRTIGPSPNPSVTVDVPATFEKLAEADRKAVLAYASKETSAAGEERKQLEELRKQLAGLKGVPTPIMQELPKDQRRTTRVQIRGNFQVTGDVVKPGVPAAFHPLPDGVEEPDRLDLARWLVDERNPLSARVAVNRAWEQLFGRGIVLTSEDFGVQGEPPTHPKLLDWLATEHVRTGWDTKRLLKLIVTSATYRQTSRVSTALAERDPDNELLARGPSFRLSAETLRDQALAASGLLSRKMYGESVRPPRPNLGLRAAFGGSTDWETSAGADRYRRGLYTSWRRTTPYPSFMTFDATSREVCTIRRIRTNTPLQALVTMNDPVYVEAAQSLARRITDEGGETVRDRATFAFRTCLARAPREEEIERLVTLQEQLRERYAAVGEAATKMATDPLGPAPADADVADLAAWTVVGNVLMNLDEFLARK